MTDRNAGVIEAEAWLIHVLSRILAALVLVAGFGTALALAFL
jgi:hypothetical protein